MNANYVIEAIRQAFDGIKREEGITLHQADVMDGYGSTDEQLTARRLDIELQWQDIADDDIRDHYFIFCYADSNAFRYYLPAYMCWSINNYPASESNSVDWTIYALDNGSDKHYEAVYKTFNSKQREAIRDFLCYMAAMPEYEDDDSTINALAFWTAFAGEESVSIPKY